MENQVRKKIVVIYTTSGDAAAFLVYPYIYNRQGEWMDGLLPPVRSILFMGTM